MLIAALVVSVFLAAMEESRMSGAAAGKQLALSAAESAIETTIATWSSNPADPIGIEGIRSSVIEGFGPPVTVIVTRLDSSLYWIVAESGSLSSQSSAMRRIGAIISVPAAPDHSITIDRIGERWRSELF